VRGSKHVKRCLIVFDADKKDIIVEFAGDWVRADLEKSFACMLRELPKHLYHRREEEKAMSNQPIISNLEV
jgi:hypothetical protein